MLSRRKVDHVFYLLIENLHLLRDFLSTRFARYIFEGCRYRMKFLEKYIFELIPNIMNFYIGKEKIDDKIKEIINMKDQVFSLNEKNQKLENQNIINMKTIEKLNQKIVSLINIYEYDNNWF